MDICACHCPCTVDTAELKIQKGGGITQSQEHGLESRPPESPSSAVKSDAFGGSLGSSTVKNDAFGGSLLSSAVKDDAFGGSLGPNTPDSNRETEDCYLDSASPFSLCSPPTPKALCFTTSHPSFKDNNNYDCSSCTPSKDLFDPFAPGPDILMLAPYRSRYAPESCLNVACRLEFDSSTKFAANVDSETRDNVNVPEDEMLLQAMYLTILEVIISMHIQDLPNASELVPDSVGFKTPTSVPRLSGVAHTGPRAPVKPPNKLRSIDKEICRRLEF